MSINIENMKKPKCFQNIWQIQKQFRLSVCTLEEERNCEYEDQKNLLNAFRVELMHSFLAIVGGRTKYLIIYSFQNFIFNFDFIANIF